MNDINRPTAASREDDVNKQVTINNLKHLFINTLSEIMSEMTSQLVETYDVK